MSFGGNTSTPRFAEGATKPKDWTCACGEHRPWYLLRCIVCGDERPS